MSVTQYQLDKALRIVDKAISKRGIFKQNYFDKKTDKFLRKVLAEVEQKVVESRFYGKENEMKYYAEIASDILSVLPVPKNDYDKILHFIRFISFSYISNENGLKSILEKYAGIMIINKKKCIYKIYNIIYWMFRDIADLTDEMYEWVYETNNCGRYKDLCVVLKLMIQDDKYQEPVLMEDDFYFFLNRMIKRLEIEKDVKMYYVMNILAMALSEYARRRIWW